MKSTPALRDPVLSVVVPARNSAQWIGETVESLCAQELPGLEIVLVDNGSTDGTASIVEESVPAGVDLRVIRSDATSAAGARNAGVAAAHGTFLAFADADDIVPDGAYRAMLAALEASGSDMVIGDHLKFSSARTWSPTKRWWPFERRLLGARPEDVPQLLSGRACWNRMFRRSFWDQAGLRFPELLSLEDLLPMTEAFARARSVDVITECVYLYRDRGDVSSLSRRADLETTLRYFEQELHSLAFTADSAPLRSQHAEVVLDADGWAHLDRFLRSDPSTDAVEAVTTAARRLLRTLDTRDLDAVPAHRRVLWLLVEHGLRDSAVAFAVAAASEDVGQRLDAWVHAVVDIADVDRRAASALATEGLLPAMVNGADALDEAAVTDHLRALGDLTIVPSGGTLVEAVAAAVAERDAAAVRAISALRRMVPLMVSEVRASEHGVSVFGPAPLAVLGRRSTLVFSGPDSVEVEMRGAGSVPGWTAVASATLIATPGRYRVRITVEGISGDFPVITARMPLPPVGPTAPIQPLADRADGWSFLVDRRAPGRLGAVGLAKRFRERLRRIRER